MMYSARVVGKNTHPGIKNAPVAQWIERLPPEQEVEGSNPFGRITVMVLLSYETSSSEKALG